MPLRRLLPGALLLAVAACDSQVEQNPAMLAGGDPEQGAALIRAYGCGSCHTVPGIRGANSLVGPPLTGISHRSYIAGVVENTPENLVRWIHDPQAVDSQTAMPDLGVSESEARHIAAYLYSASR